jgi:hypothetical protein
MISETCSTPEEAVQPEEKEGCKAALEGATWEINMKINRTEVSVVHELD